MGWLQKVIGAIVAVKVAEKIVKDDEEEKYKGPLKQVLYGPKAKRDDKK